MREINDNYPKIERIQLLKITSCILLCIVWDTPKAGATIFYTNENESEKEGYKSENLSKVDQSSYNSVLKSELHTILIVLRKFKEPLNIVINSQYAERIDLHMETTEFIPDDTELTSLFIQVQDIIRNRHYSIYITHI